MVRVLNRTNNARWGPSTSSKNRTQYIIYDEVVLCPNAKPRYDSLVAGTRTFQESYQNVRKIKIEGVSLRTCSC